MASRYWVGGTGTWDNSSTTHWSATSGGASGASVPTLADDVFFDENSFSGDGQVVSLTSSNGTEKRSRNLDLSAVEWLVTIDMFVEWDIAGDFIGSSNVTMRGDSITDTLNFVGTGNISFDPGGMIFGCTVSVEGSGSMPSGLTVTLQGDLTIDGALIGTHPFDTALHIIEDAVFDANGFDVLTREVSVSVSGQLLMGEGTWTVRPVAADSFSSDYDTVFEAINSAVVIPETSTLVIDLSVLDLNVVSVGGLQLNALYNLIIDGAGTGKTLRLLDATDTSFTLNSLVVQNAPVTLQLHYLSTYIIGSLDMNGSEGSRITLRSTSSASRPTINATTASVSYVDAKDSRALGAIPFQDVPGGIDSGNNLNWCFPGTCGNLPEYDPSIITVVSRVQQNLGFPQFVIGGRGTGTYMLFKKGSTYDFTLWRSPVYSIGQDFDVLEIKFAVEGGITGNKEIIPVLYFDDESMTSVGTEINSTNYTNSEQLIKLTSKNFANATHGHSNFFLELQMTGTALSVVKLPITIELEIENT